MASKGATQPAATQPRTRLPIQNFLICRSPGHSSSLGWREFSLPRDARPQALFPVLDRTVEILNTLYDGLLPSMLPAVWRHSTPPPEMRQEMRQACHSGHARIVGPEEKSRRKSVANRLSVTRAYRYR